MIEEVLEDGSLMYMTLVKEVKNVMILRKKLLSGELSCGFIKPSLIVDPFQILVAANKANIALNLNKMTTKNVYTELLYNLSTSKNISQSLLKFGVHDSDTDLIIVVIGNKEDLSRIMSLVEGEEVDISSELNSLTDVTEIRKFYGINDIELAASNLLDSVVSRLAAKHCVH